MVEGAINKPIIEEEVNIEFLNQHFEDEMQFWEGIMLLEILCEPIFSWTNNQQLMNWYFKKNQQ